MIRRVSLKRWLRSAGKPARDASASFCAEPLELVLRRERARSDRTGRGFSLLVFHLDPEDERVGEGPLATILAKRLRIMDYMGPLGASQLGVVLPETPASGAQALAQYVRSEFAEIGLPPRCEIHAYPTQPTACPVDADERHDRHDGPTSGHAVGNGHAGNGHAANGHAGNGHASRNGHGGRLAMALGHQELPVRPMESLFSQRLPAWKRCLDVVAAAAGLAATAPILLAAAAAIKCTSRGPVFFTQRRAGLAGKPFTLLKLRTMCVDAEAAKAALRQHSEQDGPAFKMKNDPRITWIGRILRKTSLDELPQFLNVLRGDMSLVGPRPLPCDESDQCHPWQRRRLDVTPGLTCIWQISGRSSVTFDEWMRMDLAYVRSRTLLHDLKLIALTIPAVLLQRGAQ